MTAADHLSPQQWPVGDVGRLLSGNRPGMTIADEYHQREVLGNHSWGDHESARSKGFADASDYQADLTRRVSAQGIQSPVQWEPGQPHLGESPDDRILGDGYHRYAAARALGHSSMPVEQAPPYGAPMFRKDS